jgi:hypothetical protein
MSTGLETRCEGARELEAIAFVDAALVRAAHREVFTRDETARMLHEVRRSVRDPALGGAVASVVNDVLVSSRDDQRLARRRLVDPLLDIRLVLTRGNERAAETGGRPTEAVLSARL